MAHKAVVRVITVVTAGTRVQVSGTPVLTSSVYFEALDVNAGKVYIGTSTVSSSTYISKLAAGENVNVGGPNTRGTEEIVDLSLFWVDSSVDGQIVMVTTLEKQ